MGIIYPKPYTPSASKLGGYMGIISRARFWDLRVLWLGGGCNESSGFPGMAPEVGKLKAPNA